MRYAGGTRLLRWGGAGAFLMRRAACAVAIFAACISAAWAEAGPLTSLRVLNALTNAQASHSLPVEFQATVAYFRGYENALFVQDGDAAIYVETPRNQLLFPGDRVVIKGTTRDGFKPIVVADNITVMHHGAPPPAVPATFDQLIRGDLNSRLVTVYAVVRNADTVMNSDVRSSFLQLQTDGGEIDAAVDADNSSVLNNLLDAQVMVTGAASVRFEDKMQQTRVLLHVSSLDGVKVIKRAAANPWSLPVTPMDEVLSGYHMSNLEPQGPGPWNHHVRPARRRVGAARRLKKPVVDDLVDCPAADWGRRRRDRISGRARWISGADRRRDSGPQ